MKYVRLDHYEFVKVIGPDARKFLQGQVTCNMEKVDDSVSLAGALCNLKGRVIADFRALAIADGVALQTEPGMAETIVNVLKKYAVFSKVEISTGKFSSPVLGCVGDDAEQLLSRLFAWQKPAVGNVFRTAEIAIISIGDAAQRFEVYPLTAAASTQLAALESAAESHSASLWHSLDIESGIFHVDAELSEEFTPQLLNYDISGVIDFKKCCYTGQEIVARMFYRSTAKKRMTLLSSPVPIEANSNIEYTENGATFITPVLRYCNGDATLQQSSLLLAVIGIQTADSGEPPRLTNKAQTSLQILTMPYTKL